MALTPGTRLGPYEITALIGAGGMGQVFRARDTKLDRDVALKVLPETFAYDADRLARFTREAKTLAALNHPHIAGIYGLEESAPSAGSGQAGVTALVMELVEGDDLSRRIARGPIPFAEALPIARQIAEALEAAHEQGIIHRDLKPANIKVRPDGAVKVLDFGLAKAMEQGSGIGDQGSGGAANSPTITTPAMTQAGMILGTAAYMAPEQAKGLPADHRSDIFAFGALFYELLTGAKAFAGETVHDVLASVIAREPDWTALPETTHPRLKQLLLRCLVKSRRQRWQAIGDVRAELEMIGADPTGGTTVSAPTTMVARPLRWWRRALPVAAGALAATIVLGLVALSLRAAPASVPVTRFEVAGPAEGLTAEALAITPDGNRIVSVGFDRLWVRSLSDFDMRPIAGTEGRAQAIAISPDGRSIAFAQGAVLKSVQFEGGAPVTIGALPSRQFGISWGASGILVGLGPGGIARLPAHGGQLEQLVSVADGEHAARPSMLPGNKAVLFTLAKGTPPDWLAAQVVVQPLGATERHVVATVGSDARYLRAGHIAFAVDGVWMAVPFDLNTLSTTAAPVPMVEGVLREYLNGLPRPGVLLAMSETGTLVYVPGPASAVVRGGGVVLTDRSGRDQPLALPEAPYQGPRISPNGKQLAVSSDNGRETAVWIYDLSGSSAIRRLTFSGRNRVPVWSPDSQRLAFQSNREGDTAIFTQRADGIGVAERLTKAESGTTHVPESWSSDGRFLSFSVVTGKSSDLWMYDFRDKRAKPFGGISGTGPANSQFSPDARWIAYTSRDKAIGVFIQPVPATGARYQVSDMNSLGHHPFWASNGKELFYFSPGSLVAAPITLASGPTIGVSARVAGVHNSNTSEQGFLNYDITPDDKFFVRTLSAPVEARIVNKVRVVLNWTEELKARAPQK